MRSEQRHPGFEPGLDLGQSDFGLRLQLSMYSGLLDQRGIGKFGQMLDGHQ
jgi:hypothetical protein